MQRARGAAQRDACCGSPPSTRERLRRGFRCALLLLLAVDLTGFTWQLGTPESQGMTSAGIAALSAYSDAIAPATGLMVMRDDVVVLERYTGGRLATDAFTIRSATKSFGAGLLVRALDDGAVTLAEQGCTRPDVSVHHLASMSSGMKKDTAQTCDDPFYFAPGTDFAYSDGSANRLADKLRAHYGADLFPLMVSAIMEPIGARDWIWDDQRFSSGLRISIRDMVRYGRLWLRGGDWDGVQVLSAHGVRLATSPANPQLKGDYGYLWWLNRPSSPYDRYRFNLGPLFPASAPPDAFLAAGCTSSYLLVVPSLGLVAARSGGPCISIQDGTTAFSDNARTFVAAVLDAVAACSDGRDNDGDGAADYPQDPGCSSIADTSELPVASVPLDGPAALAALALSLAGTGRAALQRRARVARRA